MYIRSCYCAAVPARSAVAATVDAVAFVAATYCIAVAVAVVATAVAAAATAALAALLPLLLLRQMYVLSCYCCCHPCSRRHCIHTQQATRTTTTAVKLDGKPLPCRYVLHVRCRETKLGRIDVRTVRMHGAGGGPIGIVG